MDAARCGSPRCSATAPRLSGHTATFGISSAVPTCLTAHSTTRATPVYECARLLHASCTPLARLLHASYTPLTRLLHSSYTPLVSSAVPTCLTADSTTSTTQWSGHRRARSRTRAFWSRTQLLLLLPCASRTRTSMQVRCVLDLPV